MGRWRGRSKKLGASSEPTAMATRTSWNQFLGWAEYAQNSLRQPSTGLTLFQCVLGYQPPIFPWSGEPSDVPSINYWFRESERVWDAAHYQLQRAVHRRKMTADLRRSKTPTYQPGGRFPKATMVTSSVVTNRVQ